MICRVILQESETDSSLSLAPTEIYQSPLDSPWSRSMIDLTLDSEIDKFELRQRMNLTLDEINKRGKISYMCMFSYICLFLVRKYIHRYFQSKSKKSNILQCSFIFIVYLYFIQNMSEMFGMHTIFGGNDCRNVFSNILSYVMPLLIFMESF